MVFPRRSALPAIVVVATVALAGCGGSKKVQRAPALEAQTKYRMAQAYLKAGQLNEAISHIEQAMALEPGNAGLVNFYGQICFIAGRHPQAEKAYRKALEMDPYLTDTHNNLGALYDRTNRKAEAEQEFLRALADPSYPVPEKVYLNLGLLYSSQGRDAEAITALRKAVEMDPKYYQAHFELAARLDSAGKLEEAASEYEVAAPDYRNSGDYHYRLGLTYLRLGEHHKAAEHLRRVREVAPGSESAARADELLKVAR